MNVKELIYYSSRILKWKFGDQSPILATIKITYRCNLKCLHCSWRNLPKNTEVSFNEWKNIFKELYSEGVRILVLEGGEPTLRNDMRRLILESKRIGLKTVLVTNGTNSLIDYNPDLIMVSIDGTKAIHEKIRGRGTFKLIKQNLRDVKSRKMSLTTLNKINQHCIEKMIPEIDPLVDIFGFNIMYPCDNVTIPYCLENNEIERIYEKITQLSPKYNVVNTKGMLSPGNWECTPWMIILCEPDGKWKQQKKCFIDYTGAKHDCLNCHLACYRGFSQLAKGDLNTWYIVFKYLFEQ